MPNRLEHASSPYLRSHADNPVDWWAWGPEPFAEAARRDVPVLVSIGYSTCHWCHVMARESFSDPGLAALLNDNFVAIKVDREEHAEVDSTYLAAAGAFTQNLGWPLNVFVTPQGRAFFAGTYWPPEPVQGHPAFRQVLEAVIDAWKVRRQEVESNGELIVQALAARGPRASVPVDLAAAVAHLERDEDRQFGGFGSAPKFPVSPVIRFLVDRGAQGDAAAQALASRTLDAMAASDLRDHDGGFFRYSTRRDWTEPHYERMLYDNAQLLAAYALADREGVASGVADFLVRTLQLPSGGFASAQDSESVIAGQRLEGAYYALGPAERASETPPALDEKVLTGWNGLAIGALALAGSRLARPDWIETARRCADFVLANHVAGTELVRASIDGMTSTARPTLEDYGMLAGGLLELALATGQVKYAVAARALVDAAIAAGDPFGVPGGADPVLRAQGLVVEADDSDGAYPSGTAALASAALTLHHLTARAWYLAAATAAAERVSAPASTQPISFGAALSVIARLSEPVRQLVVVSDDRDAPAVGLARRWRRGLSVVVTGDQAAAWAEAGFELFEGRATTPGVATAYLCEDFLCRLPLTGADELAAALD
ncbi:MAG: thioredoxin domain-containing protein [Rhodoglobus sp.]